MTIFKPPKSNTTLFKRLIAVLYYKRSRYDKFAPWASKDTGLPVSFLQRLSWDSQTAPCHAWTLKAFLPVIDKRISELQDIKGELEHQIKRSDRIETMIRRRHTRRRMAHKQKER